MYNHYCNSNRALHFLAGNQPDAAAEIFGKNGEIHATAMFFGAQGGVYAVVSATGLPDDSQSCGFFALHIHTGTSCAEGFAASVSHFNPENTTHPCHAGDLPPLLSNADGFAWSAFLTDRFSLDEIIGKTVIIHSLPDDFRSQPSGASGEKIACGVIKDIRPRRRCQRA